MGHWEALAADERLGLESKLEAAAVEKRGKAYQPPEELKDLPKGGVPTIAHWNPREPSLSTSTTSLSMRLPGLGFSRPTAVV